MIREVRPPGHSPAQCFNLFDVNIEPRGSAGEVLVAVVGCLNSDIQVRNPDAERTVEKVPEQMHGPPLRRVELGAAQFPQIRLSSAVRACAALHRRSYRDRWMAT